MIIHFDQDIRWQTTVADLNDDQPRRYYAAPAPHLLVLVVYPEVADETEGSLWLTGGKFDCSVGDHAGDAPAGYTLPEFAGYQHSKLTVLVDTLRDRAARAGVSMETLTWTVLQEYAQDSR